MQYRGDIDGLRAVAVLGVVAYHAFPGIVKSGFTGVDVFFVISGFLITQIIARDLEARCFSLVEFYARRIRRIFPALIVTLAGVLAIGWVTLFSIELEQLAKHVAAGAAFAANIVLFTEAGYFDYQSHSKPLLHLWSLGVEEQFYLVWPLLLVIASRLGYRLGAVLAVAAAVSFAANVAMLSANAPAVFYLPWFRCWELACGGLLALRPPASLRASARALLGIAGVGLIGAAVFAIDDRGRYPGWYALLPVMGTCMAIAAGTAGAANRVLAARPLVAIGLISYPLYLWHWPLLTFASILDGPLPSRGVRVAMVAVSVILAVLTYLLIERPIRTSRSLRPIAAGLATIMLVVGVGGYLTFASRGAPSRAVARAAEPYIATMERSTRLGECIDIPYAHSRPDRWYCHLNESGSRATTMVFGDSHAFALLPAFEEIAKLTGQDILFTAFSGCPPLLGVVPVGARQDVRDCAELNERVLRLVSEQQLSHVVLIGCWTYYTEGNYRGENLNVISLDGTPPNREGSREAFRRAVKGTLSRYAELPVTVHVVDQVPVQLRASIDLIRAVVTRRAPADAAIRDVSVPQDTHRRLLAFVTAAFAEAGLATNVRNGSELIGLDSVYCRQGVCPFAGVETSYYFDDNHLSARGALLAAPLLMQHLNISAR